MGCSNDGQKSVGRLAALGDDDLFTSVGLLGDGRKFGLDLGDADLHGGVAEG